MGVGGGEGQGDGLGLGASLAQGGDRGGLRLGQGLGGHRAEQRVGADLHEGAGALGVQGGDRVCEAHRLAGVGDPVGGVGCLLGAEQLAA